MLKYIDKSGHKVKLRKMEDYPIPDEFREKLVADADLKRAFYALTPVRQRFCGLTKVDYLQYRLIEADMSNIALFIQSLPVPASLAGRSGGEAVYLPCV